ncbi:MAG: glycosyltransferase family 2 protein [Parvularcula sp.]|jgi:glycosyltransferase involved in cell wall biosynthesis|nr:glycosyltransferase family 2 protein [Parvularcula sp.]
MSSAFHAALFAFPDTQEGHPALSVVVPARNEEGNLKPLVQEIAEALQGRAFEILVVDDGSTDATWDRLCALKAEFPQLRPLRHQVGAGQSRALRTGVLAAKAPVIATLDGDRQNVPADIPALLEMLTRASAPAHLAMVGGIRQRRKDTARKRVAAKLATWFRRAVMKDDCADTGCGLKLFRREAYLRLPFFDHQHRYLPILMVREGFLVEYAPVGHRERVVGRSNYTNLQRAAVAVRDVMGVLWLQSRANSPERVEEFEG